ncbi:MAG: TNT domain-containing protein [Rhodothalassiaceae bacterium]
MDTGLRRTQTGPTKRRYTVQQDAKAPPDGLPRPTRKAPPKREPYHRQDLSDEWYDEEGYLRWPPDDGFEAGTRHANVLQPGQKIDRFGLPTGRFLSPSGSPYEQRALPYDASKQPYFEYEVVRPLPVEEGRAAA